MTTIRKPGRKKKRKVGRPTFSRKDIPEGFFRYYDAYRYGFWNKREFAEYLCVSRPTLDRYFETINAKLPIVTKAENNKLRKQYGVSNHMDDLLRFYEILKNMNGEEVRSTAVRVNAIQMRFYFRLRALQRRDGELTIASIYEALGNKRRNTPDSEVEFSEQSPGS